MTRYQVEVTDTFGGEANYAWMRRYVIDGSMDVGSKADRKLIRDAKKAAGWTGLRCRTANHGDMIEIRPIGSQAPCWIMFISYIDTAMNSDPDLATDELT
jgi:hypothetical protein